MRLEAAISLSTPRLLEIRADSGLLFNPRKRMHSHIKAAADEISGHFNSISAAISNGSSIHEAVKPDRIRRAMHTAIASAMLTGFQDGANYSKKKMPKNFGKKISAEAAKRSAEVDDMMRATTRRWLKSKNGYTLTPDRAMRAARYESSNSYMNGVWHALTGEGYQKHWVTTSGDPCPNCQDAEDAGYLDFDEIFPNGLDFPLAHLNCLCTLLVR